MKDFVSKITFGFLMAQFLPGAIVVLVYTCALVDKNETPLGLEGLASAVGEYWSSFPLGVVVFSFFSVAIGMFIHGINWTVLAWLEHQCDIGRWKMVRGDATWHKPIVLVQLLISPIAAVYEIVWLVICARPLDILLMKENVPHIKDAKMTQFQFLQDFYLYFGQFYAHMSYALLFALPGTIIYCLRHVGWTRVGAVVVMYFATSFCFLLGRIQLGSLFGAEKDLRETEGSGEGIK